MTVGRIPSVEGGIQPTIVDAKGDLIAAVAADSLNRLAVGSNDQVLVADSATSTGLAWKSYGAQFVAGKNKIINGDFSINQRNWTSSTASGTFGYDRWKQINSDGTVTMSAQAFTPGTAPVAGYEASNFMRIVTSGQSSVNAFAFPAQPIEDVRTLAGQTITISFWAKAGSGTPKVAIEMENSYGTGGSPSSNVQTYFGQVTLSTSWARYSVTGTMPTLTGKTLGTTPNTSATFLGLWVSGGSTFNSRTGSLGIQNNTFDFWGVQVEAGSVATPFTTATGTIQGELAACQRYYVRWGDGTQAYSLVSPSGWIVNSTTCGGFINLPSRMRTAPTAMEYSTLLIQDITLAGYSVSSVSIDTATFSGNTIAVNFFSSGMTSQRFARVLGNASTNGYMALSAEL